ncbi:TnsA endonuclease N-terminal domain-containing protein [Paenibacillus alba]|uniref:TnsA endonuclease N-terminal domain-containing protein n=1 Tax=Paenibacillus alba TaxID=1197127 RepID=UPI001566C69C|nr:TnsA endonuclease N-terminal domain-containing protein [Paenibacillus alba]NQX71815.1 TnsA endonuclease N-terminal domain-containing protein [Paenibacillus alba]
MSKRKRIVTQTTIERKLKEKRGQGFFNEYKPWLTIRDVPSNGTVIRIKGWKTNRIHHLFSEQFELAYFYMLEWSTNVIDIREQFGCLPLEKTLYIADKMGIRHPTHPKTKHPVVLTTDFLITVRTEQGIEYWARTVKPLSKLTKRVMEKFEIEKRYFEDEGIKWGLITEREINYDLVHNMKWIHSARTLESRPYLSEAIVNEVTPVLLEALSDETLPCSYTANLVDRRFQLPPGSCLFILRYMIANRHWLIDMNKRMDFTLKPIQILNQAIAYS